MASQLEKKLVEALGAAEMALHEGFEDAGAAHRYCELHKERLTGQARAALTALLRLAEEAARKPKPEKKVADEPEAAAKPKVTGQIVVGPEGFASGRYVTLNIPRFDPVSNLLRTFGYADRREVRHLQMRHIGALS